MLFNSINFIFIFCPIVITIYYFLNKKHLVTMAIIWLILASLFFYGYANPKYVLILIFSIIFNFAISSALCADKIKVSRKVILSIGITGNILLLGYFKYMDFFISNFNTIFHLDINLLKIVLPIGISFYTFQQIAYLVDSYKKLTKEYDFLYYTLFIVFFPQLIAGPIVHHKEMIPQFQNPRTKFVNWKNISQGVFLFLIGLFKKVIVADNLANIVQWGYSTNIELSFIEAIYITLSYTFQIYYDFSGYTDMALGLGKMFNINLPENFNNPYIATNIQDFWRRWHITLSRFLRDYIYIPLGGNRIGEYKTYRNLFLTFLIGGLWHGASWMFVIWGVLHGIAIVINRLWKKAKIELPKGLSWLITFIFINITWIFFRAENFDSVKNILKGLLGLNGFILPKISHTRFTFEHGTYENTWTIYLILGVAILIYLIFKDTKLLYKNFKPTNFYVAISLVILILYIFQITNIKYFSPFIYFNF